MYLFISSRLVRIFVIDARTMLRCHAGNLIIGRFDRPDYIEPVLRIYWGILHPDGGRYGLQPMVFPADENITIALVLLNGGGNPLSIVSVDLMVKLDIRLQGIGQRFDRQVWAILFAIVLGMLRDDVADIVGGTWPKDLHESLRSIDTLG